MNKYEDEFIDAIHFAIVDAIKNDEKALWYFNNHKNDINLSRDISVALKLALDDLKGDN